MGAHHDAINFAFAKQVEYLVGGQTRPDDDFAFYARVTHTFYEGSEVLDLGPGCGRIVVGSDARSLGGSHNESVVGMKNNKIGSKLLGLCQRKVEGLFVGRDF